MDNRTDKIQRRKKLNKKFGLCPVCPIRGNENARNERTHGRQKPKYKTRVKKALKKLF